MSATHTGNLQLHGRILHSAACIAVYVQRYCVSKPRFLQYSTLFNSTQIALNADLQQYGCILELQFMQLGCAVLRGTKVRFFNKGSLSSVRTVVLHKSQIMLAGTMFLTCDQWNAACNSSFTDDIES